MVKNISRRALTEDEERVLALGLNFAVTPKQIFYRDIIAATESTARQLETDEAKQLRICVSEALSKARPPSSNIDKRMDRAIRDLRRDTDIVILPADKRNTTVVMDRTDYTMKMNTMLKDATYKKLKKDPTSRIESKITRSLRALEDKGCISDKERKYLPNARPHPKCTVSPRFTRRGTPSDQLFLPLVLLLIPWQRN